MLLSSLSTVSAAGLLAAMAVEPPNPYLLCASFGLGLGLGGLAWVGETSGWKRGLAKFLAVLLLTVGIGMLVMYAVQIEKTPLVDVLLPGLGLALLVWGLANPVVGRRLTRILAVPALALGAGLLALGIPALVLGRPPIADPSAPQALHEAFFTIGLGAAGLLGGALALALSFWGSRVWEDYRMRS
jgi:hypothetical protein